MTTERRAELSRTILRLREQIIEATRGTPKVWLGLNLTIAQLKSLFFIEYEGSTNSKKLSTALGVTPPNVTGIIDRLIEQGLVSREENPENRRTQILKTTAKGKDLLAELRESGEMQLQAYLERMSLEDLTALARGLSALARITRQNERDNSENNRS